MDLLELIKTRRSIRRFLDRPVPRKDILKIVRAATMAPSGSNQQNWHFIVVEEKLLKEQMRKAVEEALGELLSRIGSKKAREQIVSYSKYFTFFSEAPVVIAVIAKPYDSLTSRLLDKYNPQSQRKSTTGVQGIAAAIENLCLAAHALGYGTCWMTAPLIAKPNLEKLLGVYPPDELIALLPMGIPAHSPSPPSRKPLKEVITFK